MKPTPANQITAAARPKGETGAPFPAGVFLQHYLTAVLKPRPLWHSATMQDYLNLAGDDIFREYIDCGKIAWAWDIAARTKRGYRAEVRALSYCAVEIIHGPIKTIGPTAKLTWLQVVELIIPHHRPTLRSIEIQRLLSCSQQHLAVLIQQKHLRPLKEKLPACGPNSSPRIPRESLIEFLQRRRML